MLNQKRETHAIVLDFLPTGKASQAAREPIVQAVGETYFTIFELVPKPGVTVQSGQRLYIGPEDRVEIDHIKSRVEFQDLTSRAQNELHHALTTIVRAREAEFVAFFNRAGPLNIRSHALELLPGVGKKHLLEILAVREKQPFVSFADVHTRIHSIPHPEELIINRIMEELRGNSKYYMFSKPPARDEDEGGRFGDRDGGRRFGGDRGSHGGGERRFGDRPRY